MSAPTGPILARWDGRCPDCGDRINRADPIVRVAGVGFVHEICAVGIDAERAAADAAKGPKRVRGEAA